MNPGIATLRLSHSQAHGDAFLKSTLSKTRPSKNSMSIPCISRTRKQIEMPVSSVPVGSDWPHYDFFIKFTPKVMG